MASPEVQQAYSRLSDRYIDAFGSVERVHPDDLALITRHLGHAGGPVLDVGCGPGHLTGFLRSMLPDVTGIDLVPEFVAHARATQPGARFELGSFLDLDRPPGSVAGALAFYSLIHLEPERMGDALAGVRRVLAPGGVLVAAFFEGPEVEAFEHKVVTAYRWPVDALAQALAGAGFTEVERLTRVVEGERPHAMIAARAIPV